MHGMVSWSYLNRLAATGATCHGMLDTLDVSAQLDRHRERQCRIISSCKAFGTQGVR
jgi:hypothetical protein